MNGERIGKSARKEPAKKRRAEGDSGCHFPYNAWLADALKDPARGRALPAEWTRSRGSVVQYSIEGLSVRKSSNTIDFIRGLTLWDCGRFMV